MLLLTKKVIIKVCASTRKGLGAMSMLLSEKKTTSRRLIWDPREEASR